MGTDARWAPLDLSGLVARLEEAKALLEQAAVLAAAQDSARLAAMADLQRRLAGEREGGGDGDPRSRRPYR